MGTLHEDEYTFID